MVNLESLKPVLDKFNNSVAEALDLFAAFKMDELTEKWSLYAAAKWINEKNREQYFHSLLKILTEMTSEEDLSTIARIGILNSDDYLARLMLDKYESGQIIKEDDKINGNIIHEGYIVYAN